ncbi:MAG TPA: hypothetical protein P5055_11215 [Candidatus Paceibacterota bacterium]|nr:hypothetical protein [Candidatus Paceibacterota bacterium]
MKTGNPRMRWLMITIGFNLLLSSLAGFRMEAATGLGGALDKALQGVDRANQAVGSATAPAVPSGAALLLRQVDQSLDKMDRVMSEDGAKYDKDYRRKEAAARFAEAKSNLELVESRHGAKMGKDHPELVARRDRITAAGKKLEAFDTDMSAGMKQDQQTRAAAAKADADAETARQEKEAQAMAQRQQAAQQASSNPNPAGKGRIVFSKTPIDPSNPQNLTTQFRSGDLIYGLIQSDKSWREVYQAGDKRELGLMIVMAIGENQTLQYITLKKAEYIDNRHLVLDIAPALEKMTAYRDPAILFGEGKGNRKIGPIAFTYELAQLPPGKHRVQFFLRNYDQKPALGEFEIEGTDFKFYADLHEKVKAATDASATLPPAGMVNKALEGEMRKLLENAGWTQIRRVVILDKDWWLEEGRSRYLNVAAAAKGEDGKFFWSNLQFTQVKLISGAWGPLELTKTGIKRPIAEANIDK